MKDQKTTAVMPLRCTCCVDDLGLERRCDRFERGCHHPGNHINAERARYITDVPNALNGLRPRYPETADLVRPLVSRDGIEAGVRYAVYRWVGGGAVVCSPTMFVVLPAGNFVKEEAAHAN